MNEPSFTENIVPAPAVGVNKAFLEEAIDELSRKRSYAAAVDPCKLHLDLIRKTCDDNNSTLTKRDCLRSCGKRDDYPF